MSTVNVCNERQYKQSLMKNKLGQAEYEKHVLTSDAVYSEKYRNSSECKAKLNDVNKRINTIVEKMTK